MGVDKRLGAWTLELPPTEVASRALARVQAPPPPALNERSDAPPTTGAEDGTPSRLAEAAVEAPTRVKCCGCELLCISAFEKHCAIRYMCHGFG